MLTLSCQQQSLVSVPDSFNTKKIYVCQYNITLINATVLDPRFKLQWANHAEICAYKTVLPECLLRSIENRA